MMKLLISVFLKLFAILIILGYAWGFGQGIKYKVLSSLDLKESDIINLQNFNVDEFYDSIFSSIDS